MFVTLISLCIVCCGPAMAMAVRNGDWLIVVIDVFAFTYLATMIRWEDVQAPNPAQEEAEEIARLDGLPLVHKALAPARTAPIQANPVQDAASPIKNYSDQDDASPATVQDAAAPVKDCSDQEDANPVPVQDAGTSAAGGGCEPPPVPAAAGGGGEPPPAPRLCHYCRKPGRNGEPVGLCIKCR